MNITEIETNKLKTCELNSEIIETSKEKLFNALKNNTSIVTLILKNIDNTQTNSLANAIKNHETIGSIIFENTDPNPIINELPKNVFLIELKKINHGCMQNVMKAIAAKPSVKRLGIGDLTKEAFEIFLQYPAPSVERFILKTNEAHIITMLGVYLEKKSEPFQLFFSKVVSEQIRKELIKKLCVKKNITLEGTEFELKATVSKEIKEYKALAETKSTTPQTDIVQKEKSDEAKSTKTKTSINAEQEKNSTIKPNKKRKMIVNDSEEENDKDELKELKQKVQKLQEERDQLFLEQAILKKVHETEKKNMTEENIFLQEQNYKLQQHLSTLLTHPNQLLVLSKKTIEAIQAHQNRTTIPHSSGQTIQIPGIPTTQDQGKNPSAAMKLQQLQQQQALDQILQQQKLTSAQQNFKQITQQVTLPAQPLPQPNAPFPNQSMPLPQQNPLTNPPTLSQQQMSLQALQHYAYTTQPQIKQTTQQQLAAAQQQLNQQLASMFPAKTTTPTQKLNAAPLNQFYPAPIQTKSTSTSVPTTTKVVFPTQSPLKQTTVDPRSVFKSQPITTTTQSITTATKDNSVSASIIPAAKVQPPKTVPRVNLDLFAPNSEISPATQKQGKNSTKDKIPPTKKSSTLNESDKIVDPTDPNSAFGLTNRDLNALGKMYQK